MPPDQPTGTRNFVDLVIPELQRRRLFRTDEESTTLRGNLGFAILALIAASAAHEVDRRRRQQGR